MEEGVKIGVNLVHLKGKHFGFNLMHIYTFTFIFFFKFLLIDYIFLLTFKIKHSSVSTKAIFENH